MVNMEKFAAEDFENINFSDKILEIFLSFNEMHEIEDFIINPANKKFPLRTALLTCEDENPANISNLIKSSFHTVKCRDFLLLTKIIIDKRRNSQKLFFGYFRPLPYLISMKTIYSGQQIMLI